MCFYYHLKQQSQQPTQPNKDQFLKEQISTIYHTHKGRYGYRRICVELNNQLANQGIVINHKRVKRLMKEMGLTAKIRQRKYQKYSSYQGEQPNKIKDNVLQRNFKADKPNHKWATDITEFKVQDKTQNGTIMEKKLYLSPIIDLFNGEIVSYALNERPTYDLVDEMLNNALSKLNPNDKSIVHSDRGIHYQQHHYQHTLKEQGLIQSMSRKGNCLDNAPIERLEGTLKQETFYEDTKFTFVDELKTTIDEYIHYNYDRVKTKLKGLSLARYRNLVLGQTT